jgi:PAS domain S-box-containing protein
MKNNNLSNATIARQKAEELLEKRKDIVRSSVSPTEADTLKLIHELEVHQIELELQNEELELATMRAEVATKKYVELYDFAPTGYFTLTKEGEIIDLNLYGSQMLGKERSVLKNSRVAFFVSNDSKPHFNLFLEKVFNCNTKETCEVMLIVQGNSPMYVNLTGIVSENENECFVTVVDITDRKHAEEKLKENDMILKVLNADKDRFISILAHDLKSPFSSLLGFSDLLKENLRKYDMDEIETRVNIINLSAQNTFNLLEDILMWAQTQAGKIPYMPHKLSFTDICNQVVEILKPNANAKNITITHYAAAEVTVFADSDILKTILRNLVSNAIKFTNPGGQVNIYAINSQANVTISVSDNGIGIPPCIVSKLFDISQSHTTNGTANETGTGLGLLLCKEFVEKHDGKIWVESKEGKGSDFKFSLPNERIKNVPLGT